MSLYELFKRCRLWFGHDAYFSIDITLSNAPHTSENGFNLEVKVWDRIGSQFLRGETLEECWGKVEELCRQRAMEKMLGDEQISDDEMKAFSTGLARDKQEREEKEVPF